MNTKDLKVTLVLISIAVVTGVLLLNVHKGSKFRRAEKRAFIRFKKNSGPIFRGFKYSQYNESKRGVTIAAAHFSIEKKKTGIFKLSPLKFARFRGAEIDLFGATAKPDENSRQPYNVSMDRKIDHQRSNQSAFEGLISKEMIPVSALRGAVSAICEPVKINFYLDNAPVTRIKAGKAIVNLQRRTVVLENNIQVTSGSSHLSTDRLKVYPETGLLETDNYYILKTAGGTRSGENLKTDLFLNQIVIR